MNRLKKRGFVLKIRTKKMIFLISVLLCFFLLFKLVGFIRTKVIHTPQQVSAILPISKWTPEIKEMFLTPNKYSRPQIELKEVKGVVVHYTGNPGSTALHNRNYFEALKDQEGEENTTSVSSHYVIGLDGEIIQCIPLNEVAYASNNRNKDTISIETCHPDKTGKFNQSTYRSLVKLVGNLCKQFNLGEKDILRHYDVTGKGCPRYFVQHEEAWKQFKKDVMLYKKSGNY